MKKFLAILMVSVMALSLAGGASAEVTLRTSSTFAGTDVGAQGYNDILAAWQVETGNTVDDSSSTSDEAWKAGILNDFAAGNEPDILFYFAGNADSADILDKVVPISEINAAYPELDLPENELLREADGNVYAVSVRPFWEALFCNTDLFEEYDLELPTNWANFETAVQTFQENGVVPIAISLSDVPHYLVELTILSSGPAADHLARPQTSDEIPQSWVDGMELIHTLYEMGAFPENVNSTTNDLTTEMFMRKEAAMILEGSWTANGVAQENWDTTVVMPFPAHADDADETAIVGGTSMGFYITRKAWDDESKREAVVSLYEKLTNEEAKEALGFAFGGELLNTSLEMIEEAERAGTMNPPIQDAMDSEARVNYWFNLIPQIADGSADPKAVMDDLINAKPFLD